LEQTPFMVLIHYSPLLSVTVLQSPVLTNLSTYVHFKRLMADFHLFK